MLQNQLLERLLEKFHQRYLVSVYAAAVEIKPNWSATAVRSSISRKKFPLPVHMVAGESMVKIGDLAAYLYDPSINFDGTKESIKRRPGRPSNSQKMRGKPE